MCDAKNYCSFKSNEQLGHSLVVLNFDIKNIHIHVQMIKKNIFVSLHMQAFQIQWKANIWVNVHCFCCLRWEGRHKRTVVIKAVGISLAVTLLSVSILIIVVLRRKGSKQKVEDPRAVARSMSAYQTFLVQNQYQDTDNMVGQINSTESKTWKNFNRDERGMGKKN